MSDIAMSDTAAARFHMVEGQIRPNKVTDEHLVQALLDMPRELFVPKSARGIAYVDQTLPVGQGRFLLEPMLFGRLLQEAVIEPTDVVLDVGCATGYSTAILSRLAATVVGIESDSDLVQQATQALAAVGADNALAVEADLPAGYPAQGPYDVIVLNGAVAEVPEALLSQLAPGGRLIGVVLGARGLGEVRLYQRFGDTVSSRALFESQPPVLPGFEPKPVFQF
mgnify:CR=1 FL=1